MKTTNSLFPETRKKLRQKKHVKEKLRVSISKIRLILAIQKGVADSFDFWISQHPISMVDLLKDAIEDAFESAVSTWMEEHNDELIEAITRNVKSTD